MIEVRALTKRYGDVAAVDGVSLTIGTGEAFGLLGPNGAGKTTLILMIVGALTPDGGEVVIAGEGDASVPERRRALGMAPQELALYQTLTGEENLAFFGRLYGLRGSELAERVAWGLDFAGLQDRRKDRAEKYSGGMKRRLNLACALVHRPKMLFCDEPTVGVDPQSRNHIFESIEALKDEGLTLIYTTHYIEEAQRLCDRVAILDRGQLLALDSVDALIEQHGGGALIEAELAAIPPAGALLPGTLKGKHLRVETDRPLETVIALGQSGVELSQLRLDRPDLSQVFLHLTGRTLRD